MPPMKYQGSIGLQNQKILLFAQFILQEEVTPHQSRVQFHLMQVQMQ